SAVAEVTNKHQPPPLGVTAIAIAEMIKERLEGSQFAVDVADDVQWSVGQGLLHEFPRYSWVALPEFLVPGWQSHDDAFRPLLPLLRPVVSPAYARTVPAPPVGASAGRAARSHDR